MAEKHRLVSGLRSPGSESRTVWDLGANTGAFSRIAADAGAYTVAIDGDPAPSSVRALAGQATTSARSCRSSWTFRIPVCNRLEHMQERVSLADRGPADLVLALGLIHHLTLSNHVPFGMTAEFFARIGRTLVIEFVPQHRFAGRGHVLADAKCGGGYSAGGVRRGVPPPFDIAVSAPIAGTERRLYLIMRRRPKAERHDTVAPPGCLAALRHCHSRA